MKKLAVFFTMIGALAASSGAFAQAPAQPPSATPDPGYKTRLDLANQLIAVNGGRKQMETLMTSMIGAPMKAMAASLPANQRPLVDKIMARQQKMMSDLFPSIIDISVSAYASTFTEQELRDLLTFQESPSGQAMIHKMPALNARVMSELLPIIIQQMPKMMNTVVVEVCNEQHCTPEQQQIIAAAMAKSFPGQPRPATPAT